MTVSLPAFRALPNKANFSLACPPRYFPNFQSNWTLYCPIFKPLVTLSFGCSVLAPSLPPVTPPNPAAKIQPVL